MLTMDCFPTIWNFWHNCKTVPEDSKSADVYKIYPWPKETTIKYVCMILTSNNFYSLTKSSLIVLIQINCSPLCSSRRVFCNLEKANQPAHDPSSIHRLLFYLQFAQTIGVDDRSFFYFLKAQPHAHTHTHPLLAALLNYASSFQTSWPNRRCPLS